MAPKKRTFTGNTKVTRKTRSSATEVELEIKTVGKNKKSSSSDKQFDQINVQSSKFTVALKKRTSNIKITRKKKVTTAEPLTDVSSKIEFCNRVSDEPENKIIDSNTKSSNCMTFDLPNDKKEFDFDEMLKQTPVQSFSSNKLTISQKKRTLRSNIKVSKTEFSNAVELENKTKGNKVSSNCETFNLLDDFRKEFDFDKKSKQSIVQCSSSNKLSVSQRKRTCRSNTKTPGKRKVDSTDSLTDVSTKIEFSNSVELQNKIKDSVKASNCKSFDLFKDITKNFDKKSDQINVKSVSSNKLIDQFSKSSSSLNLICNLGSIIDKVRNLQTHPSIHIYSITPKGKGLSAVDVSQNLSHLAYSFPHSREIHLCSRKSLSDSIAGNDLESTWLNFASARNNLTAVRECEKATCLSMPQEYIYGHNDDVSGLRFSYNDNLLLSCSLDGSVKVIGTTTYQVLQYYSGYGSFTDIDVNTGNTQFVTTNVLSWNPFHVVYLYNFERASPIMCFSGHENYLECVRFHPNGLYIATAAADNCIKLWSVHESKLVRNFRDEGTDHPEKITFSPDGKYIASTHRGCVKIWDLASGRKLKCLETSVSEPYNLNVCYNYTGSMLATGGSDKKIHIWNITSNESSEMTPNYHLLKSEYLGKRVFSMKYAFNFFSCVTD